MSIDMLSFVVSLDTLYLMILGPQVMDVFFRWAAYVPEEDTMTYLRKGIVAGACVVRPGTNGYRFSVWWEDCRIYLGARPEMGAWLQLSSSFLLRYQKSDQLLPAVQQLLYDFGFTFSIALDVKHRVRVNRLDVACDVLGLDINHAFTANEWSGNWVGEAEKFHFWGSARRLETLERGARGNAVFLRVYDKIAQAEFEGDLAHWRDSWGYDGPVTRFEWEVRPVVGGFVELENFATYNPALLPRLVMYLLLWGRLTVPSRTDANSSRWPTHRVWLKVAMALFKWAKTAEVSVRKSKKRPVDVSAPFMRYAKGALSSAMARLTGKGDMVSFATLLAELQLRGVSLEELQADAERKHEVIKRLRASPTATG